MKLEKKSKSYGFDMYRAYNPTNSFNKLIDSDNRMGVKSGSNIKSTNSIRKQIISKAENHIFNNA